MLYEKYQAKMKKVSTVIQGVKRRRALIISLVLAFFGLLTGFLAMKGVVYANEIPQKFVYGETPNFQVGAFFGDVSYEFSSLEAEEWSPIMPERTGHYRVRALTTRAFGIVTYTEPKEFYIAPKPIDVSVSKDSLPYGDSPTITADILADEIITCTMFSYKNPSEAETEVAPVESAIEIKDSDGVDVTECYEIHAVSKTIAFVNRPISITVEDRVAVYDGKPLSFDKYEISEGSLVAGDTLTASFSKSQTNVGETDNTPELKIINPDGFDVTGRYDITQNVGKLIVEKREVVILTESKDRVYDGTAFSHTAYTIGEDTPLAEGHRLVMTSSSSQTEVGSCVNELTFRVNNGSEDVTSNYTLVYPNYSILTVTERPITVITENGNWVYDGEEHSYGEYSVTLGSLVAGHTPRVQGELTTVKDVLMTGSQLAGVDNRFATEIFDGEVNVTKNYHITYDYGTLTVTPRPITVTTKNESWVYDGEKHSYGEYSVTLGSLVAGHTSRLSGTLTTVENVLRNNNAQIAGVDNRFEIEIFGREANQTSNYSITYTYGKLTVNPRTISVKPKNVSKVYDAMPLLSSEVEITSGIKLVGGHTMSAKCIGEQTDVGTNSQNKIDTITILSGTDDMTGNYTVNHAMGSLTVIPRPITVIAKSDTKIYDGDPLSNPDSFVSSLTKLVSGHVLTAETTGTQTVVGNGTNSIKVGSVVIKENGRVVTGNYAITYSTGKLTVEPRPITIKTLGDTKTYDGTKLEKKGHEITSDFDPNPALVGGHRVELTFGVDSFQLDVGMSRNEATAKIRDGASNDVTSNYSISFEYGTLEVTPIKLTLTTGSDEKEFDNKPLICDESELTGTLANGQRAVIKVTGTITNVGSTPNSVEIVISDAKNKDVTANYEITYVLGTLTIKPTDKMIVIHLFEKYKTYDGTPLSYNADEYWTEMPAGVQLEFELKGSITNVGEVLDMEALTELPYTVRDSNGNVVKDYVIVFEGGGLTINSSTITITSGSSSKYYDEKELTCNEYRLSLGELPDGYTMELNIIGTITDVGKAENTIEEGSVIIRDKNGKDVTTNFSITLIAGSLEVLA